MKFKCRGCGAIFYAEKTLQVCEFCAGKLSEAAPRRERVQCRERGAQLELIHSIPRCEHFVLNNAPGSRCTYFAQPRRCSITRLPEYQPRAGVVPEARS